MSAKVMTSSVLITDGCETVKMHPVTNGSPKETTFSFKSSPVGSIELSITNPALFGKLKPGQNLYVNFTTERPEAPTTDDVGD